MPQSQYSSIVVVSGSTAMSSTLQGPEHSSYQICGTFLGDHRILAASFLSRQQPFWKDALRSRLLKPHRPICALGQQPWIILGPLNDAWYDTEKAKQPCYGPRGLLDATATAPHMLPCHVLARRCIIVPPRTLLFATITALRRLTRPSPRWGGGGGKESDATYRGKGTLTCVPHHQHTHSQVSMVVSTRAAFDAHREANMLVIGTGRVQGPPKNRILFWAGDRNPADLTGAWRRSTRFVGIYKALDRELSGQ
ncbi:hypothetical protein QBC37DRAFT_485655 [Rhypophila decipiens]|uniref:Uncharacterized protein n=1 Tax=Rhypophila decipiens TaxID=261697 RepID=A0AAN6XZY3_9PEZI|nr:hypothetical protein QBC37DRAFT_485655 [Rhypophila decipiens]